MASSQEGFANFEKFEVNGKAVTKLKVDELKNELKARGLEKTGLKKELVERLCKALEKENNSAEPTGSPEEKPSQNNDEMSVEEVLSTTAAQDRSDKNSNDIDNNDKDSNEQDGAPVSEDKKDVTETYENNTGSEENKDEKKSSETNSSENKNNGKETEELEDGEITGQDDEKKENQKAVPEKRRRISLTRQTSTGNNPPAPGTRKRKWSSNKPKSSVVISTDSLKGLIPGVQLASTPALEAVMELDDDKEDEEMAEVKEEKQEDKKEQETEKTNNKHDEKSPYKRRIVQVADSKTVKLGEIAKEEPAAKDKNEVIVIDSDDIPAGTGTHDDNQSSATPPSSETATPVKREISPPRNPASCAIHVSNLVRPFTQKQLLQHLSQFGAVSEEEFWINKIKSHCYAIYKSIEDATYARQSMHGQRWPSTSPRFLRVDFADNEKMLEDTDGVLGKKIESTEQKKENVQDSKERSKERSTRKHKDKKEEKKKDEPSAAANLLDKLFRKTTTTPCIYWLPLTNEQIATREKEREERRKQRQLALQQEQKKVEAPHQEERKAEDVKKEKPRENVRGKERDISRDQDRRPLRDNRVSSPPSRQRPDWRSSPVKRRSRSPAFRRAVPNRRR